MEAAESSRNPETITILVNAGAEINAQNELGLTALIYASGNNKPEVIRVLLEAGADITLTDIYNQRAIDYLNNNDSIRGKAYRELSALLQ